MKYILLNLHLVTKRERERERERERAEIIENFYHLWECYTRDSYPLYAQSPLQLHISFANAYKGKIIYPCIMAKESCFAYEEKGFFAPAPANIITGNQSDMKYLTGLLNSSMIYFAMRQFYMGGGIEGELKTNNLLKLPIPKIDSTNENLANEIIALVDKILESKAKDSKADTSTLESQIDNLVYKLYNLGEEEIKIIEEKK